MKWQSLRIAFLIATIAAVGACDATALTGPEGDVGPEPQAEPVARTACLAGGEAALRAGCQGDEVGPVHHGDWFGDPMDYWRTRQKRPD